MVKSGSNTGQTYAESVYGGRTVAKIWSKESMVKLVICWSNICCSNMKGGMCIPWSHLLPNYHEGGQKVAKFLSTGAVVKQRSSQPRPNSEESLVKHNGQTERVVAWRSGLAGLVKTNGQTERVAGQTQWSNIWSNRVGSKRGGVGWRDLAGRSIGPRETRDMATISTSKRHHASRINCARTT